MKYRQWRTPPPHPEARAALERAGLPPLPAAVLAARGVTNADEANALLSPAPEGLCDPALLRDMDKATARLRAALEHKERIAVYGDYDVDGITSTCLLTDFLARQGGRVIPYIPSRLDEGYGLNREAVTTLAGQGVSLIVTVDCGITARDEVLLARELGVDVIITDHHECKDDLPDAAAVVDPRRPDCPYPFKELAGVGVALKLAAAFAGAENAELVLERYADLVCVGTVADVMSMTGENRAIVRRGLARIAAAPRLGLAALLREAGLGDKPLTSVSIGYTLAPRINASGRMGQAMLAVELLLTDDPERAAELAHALCELNRERQTIESELFIACDGLLERSPQTGAVVLAGNGWHQGVVGIVASRLSEKYSLPCFMVCLDNGMGKGSCRSWGGVNLFEALSRCSHLLEGFGGHAMAAGFSVKEENLPRLADALRQAVAEQLGGEEPVCALDVDVAVRPELLTLEGVEALDLLEPCGPGNPRPVLMLYGAQIRALSQVGRGRHLKLRLEARGIPLDAIFFSADAERLGLTAGERVDVAFYPQINDFRAQRTVQLQLIDLRPALTRAQQENQAFEKYRRGEPLSPEEVFSLLPNRTDFVSLWRWLERQAALTPVIQDSPARISREVSRTFGLTQVPVRTLLCLDVMAERGLISLDGGGERLAITLRRVEHKVDLDDSAILRLLRGYTGL